MAIHITTPENSKIIKFEFINNLGKINVKAVSPNLNVNKLTLGETSQILSTDIVPEDYQSILSSILIGNREKATDVLNIKYVNYPKATGKPPKFDVNTRSIIKF